MEHSRSPRKRAWLVLLSLLLLTDFGCHLSERDLVGGYKLTFMNGREVRIWRPDRYVDHRPSLSVMLAGNVRQYAVRDQYITGYADTHDLDLTAEPDARTGYFLIDTKSDRIVAYGMDETQWRKELEKIDWAAPALRKPRVWF